MDDLEFRRRLFAAPNSKDAEIEAAKKDDRQRQALAQELKHIDQRIASALQVEVPDTLAQRLILKQSMAAHQQSKRRSKVHLAMAASVVLAVAIGVNFINSSPVYSSIADYSLAHYNHEKDNFSQIATINYSLATINRELADLKLQFSDLVGNLISIDDCYFDGLDSIHLVFEGKYDNITVFILPKSKHLRFSNHFTTEAVHGLASEHAFGHVIIMGDKREPLQQWQSSIEQNLQRSI
ncbi:DUF3379 family protein [Thalassotalea aquiviva]|uniref:DUF3379 family protein n=1 Tax=Thalassotalea aquiviva TaxID=3242415 RepID=UPI00352B70AF